MDVSVRAPLLTAAFWRSRRSAAIAGIVFGVLLLVALTMLRIALSADSLQSLRTDPQRRTLIRLSLQLVPFAGIAFLWFIGVVRDQLGGVEDRLFSTVFLGSGLLFVAMLFVGAGTSTSLMATLAGRDVQAALEERVGELAAHRPEADEHADEPRRGRAHRVGDLLAPPRPTGRRATDRPTMSR